MGVCTYVLTRYHVLFYFEGEVRVDFRRHCEQWAVRRMLSSGLRAGLWGELSAVPPPHILEILNAKLKRKAGGMHSPTPDCPHPLAADLFPEVLVRLDFSFLPEPSGRV